MYRVLAGVAMAIVLAAGLLAQHLLEWWHAPLSVPAEGELVQVEAGSSLRELSNSLSERGVLRYPRLFNRIAALQGVDSRIRRGEYRVDPGTTPGALLALLQSSNTVRYQVTIPEGITLADALTILRAADGLDPVLAGPEDPRLLGLLATGTNPEGWFLPETYQYQRGDTDLSVLARAHDLMRETLDEVWMRRQATLPYESRYDALIMASIIEKETGQPAERGQIAGVFVRRLNKRMRLQTDPTVIYGLGDGFDGNLTRAHLRDEGNPYNTYRHHGLPPGPIALPGRASLQAALQPEEGAALYFVARGDGSHYFSITLEEHQEAVRRFQLQRRADYRSSPEASGRE